MAESLDKQLEVADVYARALFSLAQERGRIEEIRSELDELIKLEELTPAFGQFMHSAALDDDVREAGLEKMLRGKLSDEVLNTLLVMNRHGRNGLVAALVQRFAEHQTAAAGLINGRVVTAVELPEAERGEVERVAAALSGRQPVLKFDVNPEILGGLILQIGDLRYDNSVRSQLEAARAKLLERSERGLQVDIAS